MDEVTEKARVEVMNLLRQTIRPEFLNRVDEIIMFHPLLKKEIRSIIKHTIEQSEENWLQKVVFNYSLVIIW